MLPVNARWPEWPMTFLFEFKLFSPKGICCLNLNFPNHLGELKNGKNWSGNWIIANWTQDAPTPRLSLLTTIRTSGTEGSWRLLTGLLTADRRAGDFDAFTKLCTTRMQFDAGNAWMRFCFNLLQIKNSQFNEPNSPSCHTPDEHRQTATVCEVSSLKSRPEADHAAKFANCSNCPPSTTKEPSDSTLAGQCMRTMHGQCKPRHSKRLPFKHFAKQSAFMTFGWSNWFFTSKSLEQSSSNRHTLLNGAFVSLKFIEKHSPRNAKTKRLTLSPNSSLFNERLSTILEDKPDYKRLAIGSHW